MRTNIFCYLFKSRLTPQIASTLKSKRFPNSDLKTMLGNITYQRALKIITTDKARTYNQYFAVFIFGKRHFLEYMNTCVILHWFKFVHKNSDQRKVLEPSKISHSRQNLYPRQKFIEASQNLINSRDPLNSPNFLTLRQPCNQAPTHSRDPPTL